MRTRPLPPGVLLDRLRSVSFPDAAAREVIAATLAELERDPLASAGLFPGDLVRCLMDLPPRVWRADSDLYARFRACVRGAALARRHAPEPVRRAFWSALPAGAK